MDDHLLEPNSQSSQNDLSQATLHANIHLRIDLQESPCHYSNHSTSVSIQPRTPNYRYTVKVKSVPPNHRNYLRENASHNVSRDSGRSRNMMNLVPQTSASYSRGGMLVNEQMWKYVRVVQGNHGGSISQCPICLLDCIPGGADLATTVVELTRCRHQLHLQCLNEMLKQGTSQLSSQDKQFIKCPLCKTIYGEQRGNQPPGSMTWMVMNQALPGFPNTRTIQITYHFHPGIQGRKHPNPGKPYTAHNFPRICYLPETEKGRLVLDLLRVAFDRQLVFTVGRSLTTGQNNVIVWNDIHHKTEWSNLSGHGYPDDGYLDRCLEQLAGHGVLPGSLNRPAGGH